MLRSSTSALLGSETLPNVLASLLAAPTRPLRQADLVSYWSHHKLAGQRALERAVACGLVVRQGEGRALRYLASTTAPDYYAARELAVAAKLRERVCRLRGRSGAYIFGSFAARSDVPDSDIDVLLVGGLDREAFHRDFWQLEMRLGRSINVVDYSWGEFVQRRREGSAFLDGVVDKPSVVIAGPPLAELVRAAGPAPLAA
jgi:predicted nucleotidyltransferase